MTESLDRVAAPSRTNGRDERTGEEVTPVAMNNSPNASRAGGQSESPSTHVPNAQRRTADIAQQLTQLGVTAHPLYHGGNIRIPLEDAERLIHKLQEQQ